MQYLAVLEFEALSSVLRRRFLCWCHRYWVICLHVLNLIEVGQPTEDPPNHCLKSCFNSGLWSFAGLPRGCFAWAYQPLLWWTWTVSAVKLLPSCLVASFSYWRLFDWAQLVDLSVGIVPTLASVSLRLRLPLGWARISLWDLVFSPGFQDVIPKVLA